MSKINRPPIGLQYALGNTNFGDNPSELSGVTAPVMDLWPFLGVELIDFEYNNTTVTSTANRVEITCPENELWFVTHLCAAATSFPNAGDSVSYTLSLRNPIRKNTGIAPNTDQVLKVGPIFTATAVADDYGVDLSFNPPLVVQSGVSLQARPGALVLATTGVSMSLYATLYRLKV